MWKQIYSFSLAVLLCLQVVSGVASASGISSIRWINNNNLMELEGLDRFSDFMTEYNNESYGTARDVLNQVIYDYPDQTYLYYIRGVMSMMSDDYASVQPDADYYINANPYDLNGYKLNIVACMMLKNFESALEYCRMGLELAPEDAYFNEFYVKISETVNKDREQARAADGGGLEVSSQIQTVLDIVNQERAREGLSALRLHSALNEAAMVRAEEIATVFSHTRPNGESFSTAVNVQYSGIGENIAAGMSTAEAVMSGWMESLGHRANIMTPEYKYIGIGYMFIEGSAQWVQLFMH